MTPAQAITAVREAGEELKRLDPAVGGIVDALVADIVARLSEPVRTHARTRWDPPPKNAVGEAIAAHMDATAKRLEAAVRDDLREMLPVVPATCGACEHYAPSRVAGTGDCSITTGSDPTTFAAWSRPSYCPLRKGAA